MTEVNDTIRKLKSRIRLLESEVEELTGYSDSRIGHFMWAVRYNHNIDIALEQVAGQFSDEQLEDELSAKDISDACDAIGKLEDMKRQTIKQRQKQIDSLDEAHVVVLINAQSETYRNLNRLSEMRRRLVSIAVKEELQGQ